MKVNATNIKLDHPANQVFKRVEIRAPMREINVLEPFGGDGNNQIIHYAHQVSGLEAWELDERRAGALKAMVPGAEVKVCDAYKEVAKLKPHFDVISIDNNLIQVPFEHFDLFPAIFKGLKPHSFLVIGVCTDPGGYYVPRETLVRQYLGNQAHDWVKDWDKARARFYGFDPPTEDDYAGLTGRIMPLSVFSAQDMMPVYTEMAVKAGFFTKYQTIINRSPWVKYLMLELERTKTLAEKVDTAKDEWKKKDAAKSAKTKKKVLKPKKPAAS